MMEAVPFDLPFDDAVAFFRDKGIEMSPDSWRDVWRDANGRAFTVARVAQMDVLADLKTAVDAALSQGMSLGEFKRGVRPMLERKGWMTPKGELPTVTLPDGTVRKRLTPWRLENIYRTNLQTAYSVGRWKQQEETAWAFPYLQYMAILDSRTRPAHAAMHGKVYHRDHPVWDRWYPPNGFACRCYVKRLTENQVKARGLKVQKKGVDVNPDEGWDYHVGKSGLTAPWDKKGRLPDCIEDLFAEGGCVKIVPGQKTWKEYGRPDLRDIADALRLAAPPVLKAGKTRDEAVSIMETALGLSGETRMRMIESPIGEVLIHADLLSHMVGKEGDARERYAGFIVPTLVDPFEIYATQYDDGVRLRYIGLFVGPENLLSVVRINRDGSLLWNVMQANDKAMNRRRVGELLWPK